MVLSARGYVPIEDIKVGDEVVTHKGRLRTVVRIGNERKEVGVLTGVGMCEPITCTPDHPFLSVEWRNQNTRRNNLYTKVEHCGQPEWVAAKEMPGRQWCQLLSHDNDNRAPESAKFDVKTAMYIAGMYLGDGWIRKHEGKAKKSVVLGINPKKYVKLKAAIGNAVHTVSHERTIVRVSIHDTAFADWLEAEFAHYSHLKTVPSWVMGHGFRGEFLRGFLDTDGSVAKDGKVSISTTSRSLAYGISDLMAAEGYVSSVALVETPDTCVIEGRTCSQRDYYQVRAYPQSVSRKSRVRHGMMLRTVSDFTPAGEATVFNIEVEEDHSYVVQSAIVHNCQAFSVAGLRQSLADARGNLSLEFVRLAHELADRNGLRNVVWENVVGVLSTKDNAFGCFLAGLVGADDPLRTPDGKSWPNAGMVAGPLGRAAWRVLDAQYFGLAQRRRRVIVVADFGNGADPAAVLFERKGLFGNTPPSREAGKGTSGAVKGGAGSGGEWPADVASTLNAAFGEKLGLENQHINSGAPLFVPQAVCVTGDVAHTLKAEGADASEDGTGRGTPIVAFMDTESHSSGNNIEIAPTMRTGDCARISIVQTVAIRGRDGGATAELGGEVATALRASQGGGDKPHVLYAPDVYSTLSASEGGTMTQILPIVTSAVRRLTPRECERLQGFQWLCSPDYPGAWQDEAGRWWSPDYTLIPQGNKLKGEAKEELAAYFERTGQFMKEVDGEWVFDRDAFEAAWPRLSADGPRYRALGNSWAVPKFVWLGKRLHRLLATTTNTPAKEAA
nr:LAGLIDADG family homing endonuclease [Shinella zoogloeoides]